MRTLLSVGKILAALFWGAVLGNLLDPFAQPFALLLNLAGAALLLLHGAELLLFRERFRREPRPWLAAGQVMLFGVFHLLAVPGARETDSLPLAAKQLS